MVTGPPGAGKTAALAGWARSRPAGSTGWLSLGTADNEPARFWARLSAALGLLGPPWAGWTPGPVGPGCALTAPRWSVLVVDEIPPDQQPPAHRGVPGSPPGPRLVPPPARRQRPKHAETFALHRLRLSGELAEIGSDDLRFRVEETRAWLEMEFGAHCVACGRHGGRDPPGLRAPKAGPPGSSCRRQATAGGRERPRLKSWTGRMPICPTRWRPISPGRFSTCSKAPEEQGFLLDRRSVLARLSGPVCEALTDRADANLMLAALAERNLFMTRLDEHGQVVSVIIGSSAPSSAAGSSSMTRHGPTGPGSGPPPGTAGRATCRPHSGTWRRRSPAGVCRSWPAPRCGQQAAPARCPPPWPLPRPGTPGTYTGSLGALLRSGRLAEGVRWLRRLEAAAASSPAGAAGERPDPGPVGVGPRRPPR